jgi:hypothetical protein
MPNSNTHVTTVATMEASTNGEGLQAESTDEELNEGNLHEQVLLKSLSFSYSFFKTGFSLWVEPRPFCPFYNFFILFYAVAHAP